MKKSLLSLIIILLANTNLFATCANDIDMGNHRITNVGEPLDDKDVATKYYVDNKLSSYNRISFDATNEYFSYITFPSIIKESVVNINDGGGFDPNSGVFKAPSSGTYIFNLNVLVDTFYGKNADGSSANLNDSKWREDKHIYIKKFSADEEIYLGGGRIIGKVWIGQNGSDSNRDVTLGHRKAASRSVIVKLNKGDKISIQFLKWDNANEGDKIKAIIHFNGYKLY